jgi:hypothetical protein
VDRNVEAGDADKIAMYWEGNEPDQDGKLTYSELLDKVCQVNTQQYHVACPSCMQTWSNCFGMLCGSWPII